MKTAMQMLEEFICLNSYTEIDLINKIQQLLPIEKKQIENYSLKEFISKELRINQSSSEFKESIKQYFKEYTIAVVCLTYKEYIDFIREDKSEKNNFIWINSIGKTKGYVFDKIEKTGRYYEIIDIHKNLETLENKLRYNLIKDIKIPIKKLQ